MRWPGVYEKGEVIDNMVSHLDILPTLLDYAGIEKPHPLNGTSLRTLGNTDRRIIAENHYHFPCRYNPQRSIRNRRYKLIENLSAGVVRYREHPPTRFIDGDNSYDSAMRYGRDSVARQIYERLANPPRIELYDLQADPYELTNLAGRKEHALIEKQLLDELHQWQKDDSDPYLDPEYVRNDWKKYCNKRLAD
jgi:arylsulfatase A-like enzyme